MISGSISHQTQPSRLSALLLRSSERVSSRIRSRRETMLGQVESIGRQGPRVLGTAPGAYPRGRRTLRSAPREGGPGPRLADGHARRRARARRARRPLPGRRALHADPRARLEPRRASSRCRITASPLSRLPGAARHYRKLLPLFPWAIERLRLPPCDLVLSTSHAVAKAVRPPPGAVHLCYCFTPMRYVWDQADAYLGRGLRRAARRAARRLPAALRPAHQRARAHPPRRRDLAHGRRARAPQLGPRGRRSCSRRSAWSASRRGRRRPTTSTCSSAASCPTSARTSRSRAFAELGRPLVVAGDGPTRARLEAGARAERRASSAAAATPSSPTSTRAAARSSIPRTRTSASCPSRPRPPAGR